MGFSNRFKKSARWEKIYEENKHKIMVRGSFMKSIDYWKDFIRTGRIDDYLNYIACTRKRY